MYGHSDETVLTMFLQSPDYQHFCGRIYFEHQLPIDPSSLVRWRKRVGETGMEEILLKSIEAAPTHQPNAFLLIKAIAVTQSLIVMFTSVGKSAI